MAALEIQGLTAKQKALCDIIWACQDRSQVETFVRSLPTQDRREAESMVEMMTWAFLDTVESTDLAESLLDTYR